MRSVAAPARENFFQAFLSGFTPDEQPLVAHGDERLVTFGNLGLKRALTEAAAVVVDSRFGRDLASVHPMDAALRRILDEHLALRVDLPV